MCSIASTPIFVSNQLQEFGHILMCIDIAKQIKQEQTWRIVARRAVRGIAVSHQRPDKGEVDQRGEHSTHSAFDITVWEDFNPAGAGFFESVV